MTAVPRTPDASLEAQIGQWRGYVQRHRVISPADVDELEGHLRDQVADLEHTGLSGDEAFLVAVQRLGSWINVPEFAASPPSDCGSSWSSPLIPGVFGTRLAIAIGCARARRPGSGGDQGAHAAGYDFAEDAGWYARNFSLWCCPYWPATSPGNALGWGGRSGCYAPFLLGGWSPTPTPAAGGSTRCWVAIPLPI